MKSSANTTPSLSHLTLSTATKSNIHLTNSHSLQGDLKYHIQNLINSFIFRSFLGNRPSISKMQLDTVACWFFSVRCNVLAQTPLWRTTLWRLWMTLYSTLSQLRSIPWGSNLHPQPEEAPCVCTMTASTMELCHIKIIYEMLIMW